MLFLFFEDIEIESQTPDLNQLLLAAHLKYHS